MHSAQEGARMLTPRGADRSSEEFSPRAQAIKGKRQRIEINMPGYTGFVRYFDSGPTFHHFKGNFRDHEMCSRGNYGRKYQDLPFAEPDALYAMEPDPLTRTNFKNRGSIIMGDHRDRYWDTTYEIENRAVEDQMKPTPQMQDMIPGWNDLEPEQKKEKYDWAQRFIGTAGVKATEQAVRDKIFQRTTGGAFSLRKAFKIFDRDGSGDIDPDEFKLAMLSWGLTFTDRQILALFGSYDEDCSGALDYYEFMDKVLEADYVDENGDNAAKSCRPKTPPKRHFVEQHDLYRQMVRLKEMYSYTCSAAGNRINVDEARDYLLECGHKDPEEDCILQMVQATSPELNGGLTFTQLWDWFMGSLLVPDLDVTPQYKVEPVHKDGLRDTQGKKHKALRELTQKMAFDEDGDGNVTAEEFKKWRDKRAADVDNDGDVTTEELDQFQKTKEARLLHSAEEGQSLVTSTHEPVEATTSGLTISHEPRPPSTHSRLWIGDKLKAAKAHQGESSRPTSGRATYVRPNTAGTGRSSNPGSRQPSRPVTARTVTVHGAWSDPVEDAAVPARPARQGGFSRPQTAQTARSGRSAAGGRTVSIASRTESARSRPQTAGSRSRPQTTRSEPYRCRQQRPPGSASTPRLQFTTNSKLKSNTNTNSNTGRFNMYRPASSGFRL